MKTRWRQYVLWGAVWGICEATAGFVLHLAAVSLPGLPGALMFPIGFFCMHRAHSATGQARAPLYAALVTAAVKLLDLLIPGHDTLRVLNPALAILFEGLAVTAALVRFPSAGSLPRYAKALSMGLMWRVMFSGYLYLISRFGLPAALVTSGLGPLLRFVLLESFYNSLLIYAGLRLSSGLPPRMTGELKPAAVWTACLAAVSLQMLL